MTFIPDGDCKHKNKIAIDTYNYDMEIYWECSDCGAGWRAEPETEIELKMADEISDKLDRIDAKALGLDYE